MALSTIFKINDTKSKTIARNAAFSVFIKGLNIAVNFISVPLVLSFLNTTQYGIWLTLTAVLGWFSLFDLGFGNGLRNYLTIAISNKNYTDGKIYVSTTYAALTVIFGSLLVIFLIINPYMNWVRIFNAPPNIKTDLQCAVTYSISLLFVQFVIRLINTVFLSFQRAAMADFTNAIVQVLILLGLYILKQNHFNSLSAVAIIYAIVPVIVFLTVTIIFFSNKYKHIRPSFLFVKAGHVNTLLNIGLNFFVIQIAALVIYASDNFIISQFFSPKDVTTYSIAFKYFSIGSILFTIILNPFWSMTTKAYAENDWDWIKKSMKRLFNFWLFLTIIIIVQLFFAKPLYKIWTHNTVIVPLNLSIVMCFYYMIVTWGNIFSNFLNGVGKVRLQLYFATASMLLNIPLAIIFIKCFHMGVLSIPIATIIVSGSVSMISYIQYKKIISLSATGIWNK